MVDSPSITLFPPEEPRRPIPPYGPPLFLFLEISGDQVPAIFLRGPATAHARKLLLGEGNSAAALTRDLDKAGCFIRSGSTLWLNLYEVRFGARYDLAG